MSIIVRMSAPGHYEIHTPYGTFQLSNCPVSRNDGMLTAGLRCGPRWMLTYPGEYSADADFPTKRDSIQQIKDVVEWELKNTTPGDLATQRRNYHGDNSPYREASEAVTATEKETEAVTEMSAEPRYVVNQLGSGYFVVRDTVTDPDVATFSSRYVAHSFLAGTSVRFAVKDIETGIDVATFSSRYAARDKAQRLNAETTAPTTEQKCGHGFGLQPGVTTSVPCTFNSDQYGVFGDEGPLEVLDCAVQAANDAAFYAQEDGYEYTVRVVCPEHTEQPADTCEECNEEGCGAVDADDMDACGDCSDCFGN